MPWSYEYEATACGRLSRYGTGVEAPGLWWSEGTRRWLKLEDATQIDYPMSSSCSCRTLRAFKSHLRRHPELRDRHSVRWTNRFRNCDVVATWTE